MSTLGPLAPPAAVPPKSPDGTPQAGPPPITGVLWLGLLGALLGSVISNLDMRLTAFSLSDLRGGIGFGVDESSWVSAAYNIAEVAVIPVTPWLASIISPRRAIAGSAMLLTIGGGFVPVAGPHFTALVALRFVQGLGGGALIPLLLLSVLRFTPAHQRLFGLAIYGFITACTPLFTESLAGLLVEQVGWQAVFYIALPVGPLIVFLVLIGLPHEAPKWQVFGQTDYAGMALLAIATGLLTAGLEQGQRLDWFDSPLIDALLASGGLALLAFVVLELCLEKPLIDLSLFKRFNFTAGLLMVCVYAFASLFTASIVPQYGQQIRGFREPEVGAILLWGAVAQVMVCPLLPFLLRVLDARLVMALALFALAMASRLATFIDADWVGPDIIAILMLQAAGQIMLLVPTTVVSTSVLQPKDALSGGTMFNIVRSMAGTGASAIIGAIETVRERVHSFFIIEHVTAGAPATLAQSHAGVGALAQVVRAQATVEATADAFGWIGLVVTAALVLVLMLRATPIPFPPRRA